jgi:hypothetical protein
MSTPLTLKPGEFVSESGIYQATKTKQRINLREGQLVPKSPIPEETWVRSVDPQKLRMSAGHFLARHATGK